LVQKHAWFLNATHGCSGHRLCRQYKSWRRSCRTASRSPMPSRPLRAWTRRWTKRCSLHMARPSETRHIGPYWRSRWPSCWAPPPPPHCEYHHHHSHHPHNTHPHCYKLEFIHNTQDQLALIPPPHLHIDQFMPCNLYELWNGSGPRRMVVGVHAAA
jgi:hypothetical protein